jgi:phosphate-selective porin OprO/OprP
MSLERLMINSRATSTWALVALLFSAGVHAEKERLKISGQVLVDIDYYESFWDKSGDSSNTNLELRNGRIQFTYDFPAGWEAKLQVNAEADSDGSDVDLGSAYLRYTNWSIAEITLGRMKEPLGMERNTRSSRVVTIENSMMTTSFTPRKNWGVRLNNATKRRTWSLAATVEDNNDNDDQGYKEDEPIALTGRFTLAPIHEKEQTLQFGISGSWRDWNENTFQIRNRAEVFSADNVVRSAEFAADNQTVIGLEAAWSRNSLLIQSEYMATRVEEVNGADWDYDGYYFTASYILTGEHRKLNKGKLGTVKPKGSSGAWEVESRYSYINLQDKGLGAEASITTVGLNYYYRDDIKIMLAYLYPDIAGDVTSDDNGGHAISARVQVLF